jgi:hypothetical protein
MDQFTLNVNSWIIQDRNYPDFVCGEVITFALEFHLTTFALSADAENKCQYLGENIYSVTACVVYATPELWVIDFGICAFCEGEVPAGVVAGSTIQADICLGVDPFYYFESLYKITGVPPLIYKWTIDDILMETAPLVETNDEAGRRMMARDNDKLGTISIKMTDAWHDDDGNADYSLVCNKCDVDPTKKRC